MGTAKILEEKDDFRLLEFPFLPQGQNIERFYEIMSREIVWKRCRAVTQWRVRRVVIRKNESQAKEIAYNLFNHLIKIYSLWKDRV